MLAVGSKWSAPTVTTLLKNIKGSIFLPYASFKVHRFVVEPKTMAGVFHKMPSFFMPTP